MPLPGPDTHVVELRVPGLIGTDGENLLDSVGTVEVAGDGVGRVIRPSDRLHRPAPGPVLRALGRSIPRTLEGYLWDRMTRGGVSKAAWALLFPFSLVNVAWWMLPASPSDSSRATAALVHVCRALLRVAALLLTMLLLSQLAVVSLDLFATQCLAPTAPACAAAVPDWIANSALARTLVGVLPPAVVVFVLHRVSSTTWTPDIPGYEGDGGRGSHGGGGGHGDRGEPARRGTGDTALPGAHIDEDPAATAALRCLHTVAASACLAVLLLGGPLRAPEDPAGATAWAVALSLTGFAVGAAVTHARRLYGPVVRGLLLMLGCGSVVAAVVLHTPRSAAATTRATDDTVEVLGTALFAVSWLFALLLVPATLTARRRWADLPKRLRPWAGGWVAAPTVALAALLGGGFGAGLAVTARHLLDAELHLPDGYDLITLLWGAGLALSAVVALFGVAVAVPFRRARRGVPEVIRLMGIRARDRRQAADAWARAGWERKYLHRVVLGVALALSAGATALVALRVADVDVSPALDPLSGVGVLALGLLAGGLLRAVYTAATGTRHGRHLAAFADLVCFWPRAAHPGVPPSYAVKAVPELAERARGQLRDPERRVVLAGYHVGGLLAVLAAGRLAADLSPAERERLGLVTAGAPLQWGYQRAFPAVFAHQGLARLYGMLDQRWRGLCRGTDTFGGGATTWRHQVTDGSLLGVGYLPDGGVGPLPAAGRNRPGVLVLGGDHWLSDPMPEPEEARRWVAGLRRHADYVADPEWDRAVTLAAGLEPPPHPPAPEAPGGAAGVPAAPRSETE